ncbi:alpha-amylase family glycosyl hydrolase, partial [Akkermansiaceae bacterium]|nr:alpha-amylase family glycosyl hydrolase [Akkermansiaceae bacterium]
MYLHLSGADRKRERGARKTVAVIYFMMTDRFYDGDPENNLPKGCDPATYDPEQKNVDLYHGGDFRGIELALQSGYFNDLGITAIWITPPVKNVWKTAYDEADKDG